MSDQKLPSYCSRECKEDHGAWPVLERVLRDRIANEIEACGARTVHGELRGLIPLAAASRLVRGGVSGDPDRNRTYTDLTP